MESFKHGRMLSQRMWIVILLSKLACPAIRASEPPTIPVGLNAYRQWDHWAISTSRRAFLRSTYDRRGGNEGADACHCLYQEADCFRNWAGVKSVTMRIAG